MVDCLLIPSSHLIHSFASLIAVNYYSTTTLLNHSLHAAYQDYHHLVQDPSIYLFVYQIRIIILGCPKSLTHSLVEDRFNPPHRLVSRLVKIIESIVLKYNIKFDHLTDRLKSDSSS
ncbi:hypothetical protein O181_039491 [Austropuccinia psidii MF-1]|uniref:Uncharacterized protein n=1 Tax=Austropuccinia psidii MF-1 TaxID=1389203 RepID=A0A9Q3DG15_9BASI|nr:hypothetical protein [Austropuccinia psidii MF-1]